MGKFIITEEEKNSIRKMYLMEEDETAQADEEVKNIDIKQYCSDNFSTREYLKLRETGRRIRLAIAKKYFI